jgi:hypothetical protein
LPTPPQSCSFSDTFDLKAPKKEKAEETEEEKAFKEKKKAELAAQKDARDKGNESAHY